VDAQKSAIAAKMRGKSAVAFERAKTMERQLGGKRLPGGLIGATCRFSGYDLRETDGGSPYVVLSGTCLEPSRYKGARVTQTIFLSESEYQTEADAYNQLMSVLDALGKPVSGDFDDMIASLEELERAKPKCTFNTSTRANKGGYFNPSFQGLADQDDQSVTGVKDVEADKPTHTFEIGNRISVEWEDGKTYAGVVQAVASGVLEVKFDDGETGNVPVGDATPLGEEAAKEGGDVSGYLPAQGDLVRAGGVKGRPECEVLSVNEEAKTVVLRATRTKTVYEDVEWGRLIVE
jgi:hypothetical protein